MRIAFDMLIVEQEQGEAQHSTCSLLNELTMLSTHQYIIITGRPEMYSLQKWSANICLYPVKMSVGQGILTWHQLLLPTILRRLQPDILHVPNSITPIGWNGPFVVTLYDLANELTAEHHILLYKQHVLRESIQRARSIIIPAEHSEHIERISTTLNMPQLGTEKYVYRIDSNTRADLVLHAYYQALGHPEIRILEKSANDTAESYDETPIISGTGPLDDAVYPSVSIIIPASRLEQAEQALAALSRQCYAGQLEIIMVGPPAGQLAPRWPIRAVHPEAVYPPGKARNLGAAQARGDILLFLDDDMLVATNWVEQNVQVLQQDGVGAVGARMPGKAQTFYALCADFTNYGHYQHMHAMEELLGAGSMGVHRSFFAELGGFDEELCCGEDVELCYRMGRRGYRTLYQPEIVVIHDHHYDTLGKLLRYNYSHGLQGGLITRMDSEGIQARIVTSIIQYPPLFLLLLPLIALLGAIRIIGLNISDHKSVLLYAPYIFLGKLAYQAGVFMYLTKRKRGR